MLVDGGWKGRVGYYNEVGILTSNQKGMFCVAAGDEGKGNKKMNIEHRTSNIEC